MNLNSGAYAHNNAVYGRRRNVPRHAFIWPKDGKRNSKLGRIIDVLKNEGPDMYVASHRGRGLGWNAPTKAEWSGWRELDTLHHDPYAHSSTGRPYPWIKRGASKRYDFFSRKYKDWSPGLWSDALWEEGAKRMDYIPLRLRTADGLHWAPTVQPLGQGMHWNEPQFGAGGYTF